jgi:hypothetical protein
MSEFTEEKKAKALLAFKKIIEEDKDKFHAYHDIYHAVMDSCNCRMTENEILPEREDLLRFLHRKMVDHEVHGRTHEHLVAVVENLVAVDTVPAESSLFRILKNLKDYTELFMTVIAIWQIRLKVFRFRLLQAAVRNVLAWAKRKRKKTTRRKPQRTFRIITIKTRTSTKLLYLINVTLIEAKKIVNLT